MYILKSFSFNALAQIIDAIIKFFTIPILLSFFGENNYGIVVTVISINAYLLILDLGMNSGAVKFYSQWFASGENHKVNFLLNLSLLFYSLIAVLNSLILFFIGYYIDLFFSGIKTEDLLILQNLIYLSALFPLSNWVFQISNQILTSLKKIYITSYFLALKSLLYLLTVYLTIHYSFTILEYFICFLLSVFIINISQIIYVYLYNVNNFSFNFNFKDNDVKSIINYTSGVLVLGILLSTITKTRALVISSFSINTFIDVSYFKILEIIIALVLSVGSILTTIFLPEMVDKFNLRKERYNEFNSYFLSKIKITAFISVLLCVPIGLSSSEILDLFVGEKYSFLSLWLTLWSFILMFNIYNAPGSSLLLSIGKFKYFNKYLFISCAITLTLSVFAVKILGFGGVVIGYGFHTFFIMLVYFTRIYKKEFRVSPSDIFYILLKYYLPAFAISFIIYYLFYNSSVNNPLLVIIAKTFLFTSIYIMYHISILKTEILKLFKL